MTPAGGRQLCEWPDCQRPAQGYVEAQWTVVDFVRYEVCYTCMTDMSAFLWRRRIDGQLPLIVWTGYYP